MAFKASLLAAIIVLSVLITWLSYEIKHAPTLDDDGNLVKK